MYLCRSSSNFLHTEYITVSRLTRLQVVIVTVKYRRPTRKFVFVTFRSQGANLARVINLHYQMVSDSPSVQYTLTVLYFSTYSSPRFGLPCTPSSSLIITTSTPLMPNTHHRRGRRETRLSGRVASRRRRRCEQNLQLYRSLRLPTDSLDNLQTGQNRLHSGLTT